MSLRILCALAALIVVVGTTGARAAGYDMADYNWCFNNRCLVLVFGNRVIVFCLCFRCRNNNGFECHIYSLLGDTKAIRTDCL